LNSHPSAIASNIVDFPEPFSPTKNVTLLEKFIFNPLDKAGIVKGY